MKIKNYLTGRKVSACVLSAALALSLFMASAAEAASITLSWTFNYSVDPVQHDRHHELRQRIRIWNHGGRRQDVGENWRRAKSYARGRQHGDQRQRAIHAGPSVRRGGVLRTHVGVRRQR